MPPFFIIGCATNSLLHILLCETLSRSLIAAYLGNIVGALLVALPALYFYAPDYRASGLLDAEAGQAINQNGHRRSAETPTSEVYDKRVQ